jgi:CDP-diacylglycerol--serine O-phosphatidyltransferase
MTLAARGEYYRAAWYIVICGVLDMLDGRVARMSKTGSRFGAELDSLVDIVSFGVAPAMLAYFLYFGPAGGFTWLFSYGLVMCVALRLARFNAGGGGHSEGGGFSGLPSPAAGMTIATFYPFSQTGLYPILFGNLPPAQVALFLTIAVSLAMVSTVQYARLPGIGVRTARGLVGLAVNLTIVGFGIWNRDIFFFPLGVTYLAYGLARAAVVGLQVRHDEYRARPAERDQLAPTSEWDEP